MKIYSPVKKFSGISAGVTFVNGVGETHNPRLIKWFLEKGYTIENAEQPEGNEDMAEVKEESAEGKDAPEVKDEDPEVKEEAPEIKDEKAKKPSKDVK